MRLSLRHFLGSTLWCGLLMAISGTLQVGATVQEAEFLRKVAEQYVLAQFQNRSDDIRVQVEAGRLDERRDYGGKCEGYLTAQLRGNEIRTTSQVIISCDQPGNKYTLYIPVRVSILTPALVAARNLTKGNVISPDDLATVYIDENTNLTTAVSDPNILVGSRLKRDVRQGDQIRSNGFCVVCKNDKVNIVARSHGLSLKTSGIALQEGNINESIQVRNLKSDKVISAVVTAPGEVQVIF